MKRPAIFLILTLAIISIWGFVSYDVLDGNIIQGDGYGYYSYLPGWFVHGDVYFEFFSELDESEKAIYWLYPHEDGRAIPKMTMALALFWTPFYMLASLVAPVFGFPADGFSPPFQVGIWLAGIAALFIGIWSLWSVLSRRFSRMVSTTSILLLLLGTNLLHYSLKESSMSHVYSFAAIALFIYLWDSWKLKRKFKSLIWMAVALAFITLIRPTNIIVGLLPLTTVLLNPIHRRQLLQPKALILPVVSLLVFVSQMIVWYNVTGDLIYYSYPGENFFWLDPHIIDGLFSFRNGWLLYTPLMALSIIGIPLLRNIDKELMWSSLAILLMHVYIVFSWWCWYYGDSLSIRPMIDIYPFLAVSLAAFLAWALRQNGWIMTVIVIILGFFMLNNRVQHIQYADQKLSGSAMTLTAFSELFFNPKYDGDLDIVGAYKYPDTESLRAGLEERIEFDTIFGLPRLDTTFSDFIKVSDEMYYSPTWEVPYDLFKTELKSDFILVELMLDGEKDNYENARLVASFNKGESSFDYRQVRLGIVANQHYVLRKPRNLPEGGVLQLYLWQKGVGSFNLEGMSVSQVQISYSKRSLENY